MKCDSDFLTDLEDTLVEALKPFALRGALPDGLADGMLREIRDKVTVAIKETCERHEVR